MPYRRLVVRTLAALSLACAAISADAQTVEDGAMVDRGELRAGAQFTIDTWSEYWEGTLKRSNDNIGTVTTQSASWVANYGLTERVNVIASVPYVWTNASLGVLHGIQGLQDLSLSAKYRLLGRGRDPGGFQVFGVASFSMPMTNYNLELLPLSIGLGSTRVSGRGTVDHHADNGWFVTGSGSYTWRSDAELDRPYFFTADEFVMSQRVDLPNVADYVASSGYMYKALMVSGFVSQQWTLGGGDIRRQDMPFLSNRMNATQAGAMSMLPIPGASSVIVRLAAARTLTGRNVGQASTFAAGIVYRFNRGDR